MQQIKVTNQTWQTSKSSFGNSLNLVYSYEESAYEGDKVKLYCTEKFKIKQIVEYGKGFNRLNRIFRYAGMLDYLIKQKLFEKPLEDIEWFFNQYPLMTFITIQINFYEETSLKEGKEIKWLEFSNRQLCTKPVESFDLFAALAKPFPNDVIENRVMLPDGLLSIHDEVFKAQLQRYGRKDIDYLMGFDVKYRDLILEYLAEDADAEIIMAEQILINNEIKN